MLQYHYAHRGMKRIFAVLLMLAMLTGLAGCGSETATKNAQESTTVETQTAVETETVAPTETEKETETEAPTEPETESLYNKDGTRRAWICSEGNVNVREKASAKSTYLGRFVPRQEIRLLSEKTKKGYYHVKGKSDNTKKTIEGYALAECITLDPPENPQVKLDVVHYLQTDKQWGSMELGRSNQKVKDKGCAATCLAMSETFIKGVETTPKDIVENNTFTSAGNIGWPKDYYWDYNKRSYLQLIYTKLHEGIPVLVNFRRYNGSQHWVLVTGYTGNGADLKESDFLINDPLVPSRKTLKDFTSEFVVFKKVIYYCEDRAKIKGTKEYKKAHKKSKKKSTKKKS